MIKHLFFLNVCKNSCLIFIKIFSVKMCDMYVTKNQILMLLILVLTEYKSLNLTYLNIMSRLIRKKFIKTMFFYLYIANSLEFNEECSIVVIDQA